MASSRVKAQPVGSDEWIVDENRQVSQFRNQELGDFSFAARNEVEWLNEHMLDIFSKSQVDVTEIFKTPGKLRGKTPRTARKRDALGVRQPLTDVFSTNARQAPQRLQRDYQKEDPPKITPFDILPSLVAGKKPTKANTDSGYHGLPEDESDTEEEIRPVKRSSDVPMNDYGTTATGQPISQTALTETASPSPGRGTTTEGSFHSAREGPLEPEDAMPVSKVAAPKVEKQAQQATDSAQRQETSPTTELVPMDAMELDPQDDDLALDEPIDESHLPSQGSSPFEPLVRKSSLTFAALPAPEPWTTKKSMGARVSRTSQLDQTKNALGRSSYLGRITGGKSLGAAKQPEVDLGVEDDLQADEMDTDNAARPAVLREESDGDAKLTRLHNKSSTQRLHEKISMLGKPQPVRPAKSIPTNSAVQQPSYPELPSIDMQARAPEHVSHPMPKPVGTTSSEEDEDDWIQPPPMPATQAKRPQLPKSTTADVMENIRGKQHIGGHDFEPGPYDDAIFEEPYESKQFGKGTTLMSPNLARSASAAALGSPQRDAMDAEASVPEAKETSNHTVQSVSATTQAETPAKRNADGPISASKSKLQSIMKTARGLFTSSAGVSAQAKIEALSSPSTRTRGKTQAADVTTNPNEGIHAPRDSVASKQPEVRKTRSSTEKEERRKEQEVRLREQEETKKAQVEIKQGESSELTKGNTVSKSSQPARTIRQSPRRLQEQAEERQATEDSEMRFSNMNSVPSAHPLGQRQAQQSQLQRPKDLRRPVKPAKESTSKPIPQKIRVGAPSALTQQRMPVSNSALSSSLQESLPPAHSSRPGLVKKASNASIQTSVSNTSLKSSTSSKPKALIAAERKKEQDEKEAQRKMDQKKEIERKRAAQQEEARQQERLQREEAERQRERKRSVAAEDPKKAASRQLIEKRRLELAKKEQQQRAPQRPNHDTTLTKERLQVAPPTYRQELGGARPPSRLHTVQDSSRPAPNHPPPNPARPPIKRVLDAESEEEPSRTARAQAGQSYQVNEGKRRRTGDDELQEQHVRPTMAPPIRQSNIRKDLNKQSIYNYSTAPPPASHHTSTLLKTSTMNQTYQQQASQQQQVHRPGQQPHDMAKYGTARPPFADAPNPPAPTHKTPLPKHLAPPSKASPQFVNGENIHLDDIPTDSDSDDSPDPAKRTMLPDWVQSPELRRLIEEQEKHQNADSIFGPPQTPRMEEMFKDRHQRFRNRTSSANWTTSGDRLTEEEKVADRDARERLRREGGWTFGM